MKKTEKVNMIKNLLLLLKDSDNRDIENGIMCYCLSAMNKDYSKFSSQGAEKVIEILKRENIPNDIELVIEIFESLLESSNKNENGIVFTPRYIVDYIVSSVLERLPFKENRKIIDPGCGAGSFLIAAAERLYEDLGTDIDYIIENYIYGIDLDEDNVRRCILSLRLLSAEHGGDYENVKCNIKCADSLKNDWAQIFDIEKFSYVIGNPPYVNPHDMNPETASFLKDTFVSTKKGVFNIFYAFIEHAMDNLTDDGVVGYIVPNNFLTIKSAENLRKYLQSKLCLSKILDFGNNMVFKPVRTYNCILILNNSGENSFDYAVMEKAENIESALKSINFDSMRTDSLDFNGWKLVDKKTRENLKKIESQAVPIKPFIRTGIATLRDAAFMVEADELGYFKMINKEKLYVESELVKPIYKIPELKLCRCIEDAKRHIIFPYYKLDGKYTIIPEAELKNKYPLTYKVLLSCKDELDKRDKGKANPNGWYAYGRSQGLNKYGRKLLFPTFAAKPKFMYVDNEDALFCNGYGVFENDVFALAVLEKVLNSSVMNYYVRSTSYSIEGGYYCYQKKYIENFSVPKFTKEQLERISDLDGKELDAYLWKLYGLE